jgi:hypothetical protein
VRYQVKELQTEDILKLTAQNESLHEFSNDNWFRVVYLAYKRNLITKSKVFPCCNIYKYTVSSPDGQTHSHMYHILIGERQESSIIDALSLRGADFDADHCLGVTELGDKLSKSKQTV